jgi:hypothetical protein
MTWTEREHRLRTRRRRRRGAAALGASLVLHGIVALGILLREPPPAPRVVPASQERPAVLFLPREKLPPPPPELQPWELHIPQIEPPQAVEPLRAQLPPPPEKKKPKEPVDPFADLPALWWQRETAVAVMDRMRRGVVAADSLRLPLVRLGPASRELATAMLNDHFQDLRPWLRAEAAKETLKERFPYLGE